MVSLVRHDGRLLAVRELRRVLLARVFPQSCLVVVRGVVRAPGAVSQRRVRDSIGF